jgi:hypothetical protein
MSSNASKFSSHHRLLQLPRLRAPVVTYASPHASTTKQQSSRGGVMWGTSHMAVLPGATGLPYVLTSSGRGSATGQQASSLWQRRLLEMTPRQVLPSHEVSQQQPHQAHVLLSHNRRYTTCSGTPMCPVSNRLQCAISSPRPARKTTNY